MTIMMMRKSIGLLVLAVVMMTVNAAAFAAEEDKPKFKENVHYKVLDRPYHKNEVIEVYSVYCNLCYLYDGVFSRIASELPKDVTFKVIHISGDGKFLYAPAKILYLGGANDYTRLKNAMFRLLHEENVDSYSSFLKAILPQIPMSLDDFHAKEKEEAVIAAVEKEEKEGRELARKFGIPVLLVNNKYALLLRRLKNVGEIKELIDYLLKFDS